jgi:hypothetical protein
MLKTSLRFSRNGGNNTEPVKCTANKREVGGKCVPIGCPKNSVLDENGRCIPICDETELPDGETCYDDGDPTDPIDDGPVEPPTCTPYGPECPPCPEGVEAGWCADEDERGDFDCGDEGMENDPRCKDREPVNGSEEPEVVVEELPEEEEEETEPPIVEEEPVEEETTEEIDGQVEEG